MSNCPRCAQRVDSQAVKCPYCRTTLKAFGHPGIPLHRAEGDTFLCDSCTYHEDDSCNYPQRPYAKTCTLYHDRFAIQEQQLSPPVYKSPGGIEGFKLWCQRNKGLAFLLALLIISFLVTISR